MLRHHGEAEGHQQAKDRIGGVEATQNETLKQNSEQTDDNRGDHDGRAEAEIIREFDRYVGAESVKRAVRQIDHAADAKDQGQTKRDQQVVASEYEAVDHLFQQEHERTSQTIAAKGIRRQLNPATV